MTQGSTTQDRGLLARLSEGPLICAEGYVFELERRGYIKAGAYVPEVVLDNPEALYALHREFGRAGSDVMVALTYYAHREKLRAVGRENDLEQMNQEALRISSEVAGEFGSLVAGDLCNTWSYAPEDPASADVVRAQYTEQLGWCVDAGVDFILAETIEYLGEALIALEVIRAHGLPSVINLAPIYEHTKDEFDWIEAAKILSDHGADVVGFNCSRGLTTMMPLLRQLREAGSGTISAVPVPYRTTAEHPSFQFLKEPDGSSAYTLGLDQFLCTRIEAAQFARDARDLGVGFIGLCCGAGPHHIRAMAEALGRTVVASRYSPDLSQHSRLGSDEFVRESEKPFLQDWR